MIGYTFRWVIAVALFAAPTLASEGGEQPNLFTGDLGNVIWSLATFLVVLGVLGKSRCDLETEAAQFIDILREPVVLDVGCVEDFSASDEWCHDLAIRADTDAIQLDVDKLEKDLVFHMER